MESRRAEAQKLLLRRVHQVIAFDIGCDRTGSPW